MSCLGQECNALEITKTRKRYEHPNSPLLPIFHPLFMQILDSLKRNTEPVGIELPNTYMYVEFVYIISATMMLRIRNRKNEK